jgi:hypothetical protein
MGWFDWYTLVGMGGFFVLLGIVGLVWGKHEESAYYEGVANRPDVREFMDHLPWRPEPHALMIGGRICLAVGLFLLVFGGVWWLRK